MPKSNTALAPAFWSSSARVQPQPWTGGRGQQHTVAVTVTVSGVYRGDDAFAHIIGACGPLAYYYHGNRRCYVPLFCGPLAYRHDEWRRWHWDGVQRNN